jgi:insulysin
MIKETGIKKWFFDETKSLLEMDFNFSEKCSVSQYTSALSEVMQQNLPPQLSLSGLALLRKYDAALINQHLALLRPDNFRVTLACQEFPNGIQCTQVEKWYSTSYELLPLSESLTAVSNRQVCNMGIVVFIQIFFIPEIEQYIRKR